MFVRDPFQNVWNNRGTLSFTVVIVRLRWIFEQRSKLRFEVFHTQLYVRFFKSVGFYVLEQAEMRLSRPDFSISIQLVTRLACDAMALKGAECNFQLGRDELI